MIGEQTYWAYFLASKKRGTIYIGVTNHLINRVFQHRTGAVEGFTKKYKVHRLVRMEPYRSIVEAIKREKQVKKWRRAWKIALIEEDNPNWDDLWPTLNR